MINAPTTMHALAIVAAIAFLIYLTPLLFIAADLWSGIRKAKARGEMITSYKTRRTVYKINKYYNCLLALSVLDALQIVTLWYLNTYHEQHLVMFPFVTLLGAVGIGVIETRSILEPADVKERKARDELLDAVRHAIEDAGKPSQAVNDIIEYLKNGGVSA